MQWFNTKYAKKRLHGVVGIHPAATATSGTRIQGIACFLFSVYISSNLKTTYKVNPFICLGIYSRLDRAVGHKQGFSPLW